MAAQSYGLSEIIDETAKKPIDDSSWRMISKGRIEQEQK